MKNFKRIQYPPQNGVYKVKVKNGSAWRFFDTCRLQISVGQEKHEGDKLKATLDWADSRFEKIIVCVNDTLQRYNLMSDKGMDEMSAREESRAMGDRWLVEHLQSHTVSTTAEIIRWDHWLDHADYPAAYQKISDIYLENALFREAFESEIDAFMKRKSFEDPVEESRHRDMSSRFLLEEIAAFPLMFEKDRAADIYPGNRLLPVRLAEEGKIEGYTPAGNVVLARIDFQRILPQRQAA